MFTIIRKLLDLSTREKIHLYLLFVALAGMALIEMAGVASILPFMEVIGNPEVIQTNKWLKLVYDYFEFGSLQSFLFFLGMLMLGLLVFSNLFKVLTSWLILRYDNRLNYILAQGILAVVNDIPLHNKLGARARKWVQEKYSSRQMEKGYLEIYRGLLPVH